MILFFNGLPPMSPVKFEVAIEKKNEEILKNKQAEAYYFAERITEEHLEKFKKQEEEELKQKQKEERKLLELKEQERIKQLEMNDNNWSLDQMCSYISSKTGIEYSRWRNIAIAESSGNKQSLNSIGCFGWFQIHPCHGNAQLWTDLEYANKVIEIYYSQGLSAWEVVTMGRA